jgi:hypothetical protein
MTAFLASINWTLLGQIALAFLTAVSALNGLAKYPQVETWISRAIDFLSFLTRSDSPGTLKMPFRRSESPNGVIKQPMIDGGNGPHVALLALVLAIQISCGAVAKQLAIDIAACALGQVPGAVVDLIPDVVKTINGSAADWAAELAALEAKGLDVAVCAVEAAIHDMSLHQPAAMSPLVLDRASVAIEHFKHGGK